MIPARLKSALLRVMPFSPLVFSGRRNAPVLYLTFDDGPNGTATVQVLDLLQQEGVQATFFCIGGMIARARPVAERIVADGHLLANHSWRHRAFHRMSLDAQLEEVERTDALIAEIGGGTNRYFRAPQGRWSLALIFALRRRNRVPVHWSYDSRDYCLDSGSAIAAGFAAKPVRPGEILLFHDDKAHCVPALRELLPRWRAAGYRFGLISELA